MKWNGDRAQGVLWGLAIGDALGAPVDGLKSGHIRQLIGAVAGYVDLAEAMPDRPERWRRPALHTDDGQQALALVEALVEGGEAAGAGGRLGQVGLVGLVRHVRPVGQVRREVFAEDASGGAGWAAGPGPVARELARALVAMKDRTEPRSTVLFGAHRGTGAFFRRAVVAMSEFLADGLDDRLWGAGQFSAGTGGAMRIAPMGVWPSIEDDEALVRAVIDVTLLTHNDPRGVAAAAAVAAGTRAFAESENPRRPDVSAIMDRVIACARRAEDLLTGPEFSALLPRDRPRERDRDLSKSLEIVASVVREGDDDLARRTFVKQAQAFEPANPVAHPNHGFAPVAIPMAFYRALGAAGFARAVEETINDGGDADTMGAIVGALAGARFGLEAIPENWRGELIARRLVGRRAAALAAGRRVEPWDDLIETEWEWTRDEEAARRSLIEAGEREADRRARRARERERRAKAASRQSAGSGGSKPSRPAVSQDMPFAPPPDIWLRGKSASTTPGAAKGAGAGAGDAKSPQGPPTKNKGAKKIIPWKEERRRQKRER